MDAEAQRSGFPGVSMVWSSLKCSWCVKNFWEFQQKKTFLWKVGHLEGKRTCTYFLQWFCLPKSHSTYHVCKVLVCSINWCWYSKKPWHTLYSCVFFSSNLTAYPWFRARASSSRRHCTAGSAVLTEWLKAEQSGCKKLLLGPLFNR